MEAEQANAELANLRQEVLESTSEAKALNDESFNLKRSMEEYRQSLMDLAQQDPVAAAEGPTPEEQAMEEQAMAEEEANQTKTDAAKKINKSPAAKTTPTAAPPAAPPQMAPPPMASAGAAMGKAAAERIKSIYANNS